MIQAAAQHPEVASWALRGWEYLFGKRVSIAFTGMEGVGKTVLLHHLTGEAFEPGYQRPLQSESGESGTIRPGKARINVTTIPGQKSYPRVVALDKIFNEKDPVQGVVHLVSWGYPTIRTREVKDSLLNNQGATTIDKLRGVLLKDEEDDFTQTCQYIRASHNKKLSPKWLLLAIDKVDLYEDKVEKARVWYSSGFFAKKLQELQGQLGSDYFRWAILPVCACLDPFEWNGELIQPKIDDQGRAAYLTQLHRSLANFCQG